MKEVGQMLQNKNLLYGILGIIFLIMMILIIPTNNDNNEPSENENNLSINHNNQLLIQVEGINNAEITEEIIIENPTNEDISYTIKWQDVENSYINQNDLTYKLTALNPNLRSLGSTQLPTFDIMILEDITISPGQTHTYELSVTYNRSSNSEDNDNSSFTGYIIVVST